MKAVASRCVAVSGPLRCYVQPGPVPVIQAALADQVPPRASLYRTSTTISLDATRTSPSAAVLPGGDVSRIGSRLGLRSIRTAFCAAGRCSGQGRYLTPLRRRAPLPHPRPVDRLTCHDREQRRRDQEDHGQRGEQADLDPVNAFRPTGIALLSSTTSWISVFPLS